MSNIIPFPKTQKENPEAEESEGSVKKFVQHACIEMGLCSDDAEAVCNEYLELHKEIFKSIPLSLKIPREAGLTEEQIQIISVAQQEAVVDYASFHQKKISKAAHALIGVMIREKLGRR